MSPLLSNTRSRRPQKGQTAVEYNSNVVTGHQYVPIILHTAPTISTFNKSYDPHSAIIEEYDDKDKQELDVMWMKPWRKKALHLLPLTLIVPFFLSVWATVVQVQILKQFQRGQGEAPSGGIIMVWIMMAAELALTSKDSYVYTPGYVLFPNAQKSSQNHANHWEVQLNIWALAAATPAARSKLAETLFSLLGSHERHGRLHMVLRLRLDHTPAGCE